MQTSEGVLNLIRNAIDNATKVNLPLATIEARPRIKSQLSDAIKDVISKSFVLPAYTESSNIVEELEEGSTGKLSRIGRRLLAKAVLGSKTNVDIPRYQVKDKEIIETSKEITVDKFTIRVFVVLNIPNVVNSEQTANLLSAAKAIETIDFETICKELGIEIKSVNFEFNFVEQFSNQTIIEEVINGERSDLVQSVKSKVEKYFDDIGERTDGGRKRIVSNRLEILKHLNNIYSRKVEKNSSTLTVIISNLWAKSPIVFLEDKRITPTFIIPVDVPEEGVYIDSAEKLVRSHNKDFSDRPIDIILRDYN
ncbi:MAG: hypothetical protein WCK31_01265 [bacterium]